MAISTPEIVVNACFFHITMAESYNKTKYISLKEAAEISGYTPDYLGQLIRKGKLHGKQIYLNVAWVTTEDALRGYLDKNKSIAGKGVSKLTFKEKIRRWMVAHSSNEQVIRMAQRVIYVVIAVLILFCLFLAYAFLVNLFRRRRRTPQRAFRTF